MWRTDGRTDRRTDGRTDGPTDGPTDRVTYRVACTQLKTCSFEQRCVWRERQKIFGYVYPWPLKIHFTWLVSSPFWIGVVQDWCRLSWLAPAEMKENNKAHVHREQSITLIGSHKSSFTIQTVPYLTCTWSLTFVYMEPLLHLSSYAKYRLDKKNGICARNNNKTCCS